MALRSILLGGLGLVLLGCASEPPPIRYLTEAGRTYDQDRATTRDRLIGYLQSQGMVVQENPDGTLEAVVDYTGPDEWATCGTNPLTTSPPQIEQPRVVSRRALLEITVWGDAAQSRVDLRAEFTERLASRITNVETARPCRSTGVLEAEALEAPLRPLDPDLV